MRCLWYLICHKSIRNDCHPCVLLADILMFTTLFVCITRYASMLCCPLDHSFSNDLWLSVFVYITSSASKCVLAMTAFDGLQACKPGELSFQMFVLYVLKYDMM